MRYFMRLTLAALLSGTVAVAQDACPGPQVILDLAQSVLQTRDSLNRFQRARVGAEALYLTLHYGGATPETLALMDAMATEERNIEALDLAAAYRGVDGLAMLDPDPVVAISEAGLSLQRAVLLVDRGETYASLMAQALGRTDLHRVADITFHNGRYMVYLLADQDDQMRLDVARAMVAHGLPEAAAYLLADRADQTAWTDLMAKMPDHASLQELGSLRNIWFSGATLRLGNLAADTDPSVAAETLLFRTHSYQVFRAQWAGVPGNFLGIYMNQSGHDAIAGQVASAVLAQIESGGLNPVADPDAVWLFEYKGLAKLDGQDVVQRQLASFDFPNPTIRHFGGTALQTLDTILARETLGPVFRQETDQIPARPALLSPDFDWDNWVRVMRRGIIGDVADGDYAIMAELLTEQGEWRRAATSYLPGGDPYGQVVLTRDLLLRVDRQCDAALAAPGQGFVQTGQYLFRF